ncbi:MAG TPA: GGDEF and EAL domain-containing protein [Stellaceae bacterium]|nr:GGDEF and EAL domain-containing protein [Stellaceae bacterium]
MSAHGRSAKDHLLAALEGAGDLAYVWELASDQLRWYGASLPRLGLGIDDPDALAIGESFTQRIHADDRALRQKHLEAHTARGEAFECEYRLRTDGGTQIWVQERGRVEFDPRGHAKRLTGVLRPVTGRKTEEQRLERLANHDELTGHFNRTRLREALDHAIATSMRSGLKGAYLAIGIDKLATVNDAFGYETADQVIIEIGQRLDRQFRDSDVIGRVGGDRFGVVLTNCPESEVAGIADKILQLISQTPIPTRAGPLYATISIGSVSFPDQVKTSFDAMTRAETALAEAKRAGRDCFVPYRLAESQRRQHRTDLALGERVQRALKEERLVFAYQPVVDSDSGTVDYYECLLRMIAEDGSIVAAGAFVPVIEQLGFVRLLDRYVLERAVAEVSQYPEISLGFNISGLTAADHAWLRLVVSLLKDKPEIARRLTVEITETAALYDIQECARFVSTLRELGCRVALDDFGAGFTSLRHLQTLDVDIVKIDGSFVRNLADSYDDQIFLRHLVGLADGFGLATVAECVESAKEAAILRREGVQFLQGYHFGIPGIEKPWLQRQKVFALPPAAEPWARSAAAS